MLQQLDEIEDVLKTISSYCAFRIEINKAAGISIPRIIRLCEKYRFSQCESNLFHLMTVSQVSSTCIYIHRGAMLQCVYLLFKHHIYVIHTYIHSSIPLIRTVYIR